jgi:hypothetical protein
MSARPGADGLPTPSSVSSAPLVLQPHLDPYCVVFRGGVLDLRPVASTAGKDASTKLGDSTAYLLINQAIMATLQERRLGYHFRTGLEPGTS